MTCNCKLISLNIKKSVAPQNSVVMHLQVMQAFLTFPNDIVFMTRKSIFYGFKIRIQAKLPQDKKAF